MGGDYNNSKANRDDLSVIPEKTLFGSLAVMTAKK